MNKVHTPAVLFILLLALSSAVLGQKAQFTWSEPMCEFTATYDQSKYPKKQIEDTRKLIDFGMGLPLQTDQSVFDIEDLGSLDVNALDEEYKEVLRMLEELTPVNNEYFRELKERHIRTLKASYRLKRITLLAHTDAKVLKEASDLEACFVKWGKAVIAGGDELTGAWKTLHAEQMERNGRPDMLQARFDQRYGSPERLKWALTEVLNFGWWNCVNESIPYVDNDGTPEEEFRKLFVSIDKEECEEP